jgi:exodeoxyribonuclease VII small subunit
MTDKKMTDKNELSFEQALELLEKIVDEMEGGDLKLDESLDHFERGMKLAKQCGECLGKAEKRIEVLVNEAGGEDGVWEPFGESE